MIDHTKYPLQKANTGQYVYHLSYKKNRQSIEAKGIIGYRNVKPQSNRGLVFAHNTNQVTLDWYWLCLDIYELQFCEDDEEHYPFREQLRYFVNKHYDIWRIDNEIANKNWYIDFIGLNDCMGILKTDYYVKCFGNIAKEAITLCTIDNRIDESIEMINSSIIKTYFNPIIARSEYIMTNGFEPEEENTKLKKHFKPLEVDFYDEKMYMNVWKQIKHNKIKLKKAA